MKTPPPLHPLVQNLHHVIFVTPFYTKGDTTQEIVVQLGQCRDYWKKHPENFPRMFVYDDSTGRQMWNVRRQTLRDAIATIPFTLPYVP